MAARFADRIGKGIRGAPRDAMLADETPPEIRGRAFGLRQALDTVGALLAPLASDRPDGVARKQHPNGVLDRGDPGRRVVPARLAGAARARGASRADQEIAFVRRVPPARRGNQAAAQVGFLFTLARFSEGFLILKGIDIGLSEAMSPLTLAIFNLAYVALAYPAGALSDRMSPRSILMAGIAVLIAGNLVLAETEQLRRPGRGHSLWGAHMALTQGIFSRMIADSAPEELRATSFGAFWFVTGIGGLLASLGAGWMWDRQGASATFLTSAIIAGVALAMLSLLEEKRA